MRIKGFGSILILVMMLSFAANVCSESLAGFEETNDYSGKYDLNITPIHGQSLSLAILHAVPPIHTDPIAGGFMLSNGVYQVNDTPENMKGIDPLREGYDIYLSEVHGYEQVENSAWGTAERIALLCQNNDIPINQQFYFSCGQDGTGADTQFDTELVVMQSVFDAVKLLKSDKRIGVPLIYWIQGEYDNSAGIDKEEYKTILITGLNSITSIARSAFGQTEPIKCITYQTAWTNNDDREHYSASLAQMELCRDNDCFAPSCPAYVLIKDDIIHINNWGQYLLGTYQGIQFYDWVVKGKKHRSYAVEGWSIV